MLMGQIKGNVALGVALHYTRMFMALVIFPQLPDHPVTYTILLTW